MVIAFKVCKILPESPGGSIICVRVPAICAVRLGATREQLDVAVVR